MSEDKSFKNYVVAVYNNGDYAIFCSSDHNRAFGWEQNAQKTMNHFGPEADENIYFFGAESLEDIIAMYGHHFGED